MNRIATATVELTQGNINNAHFYLRDCLHLFPRDVIGAPDQRDGLGRLVEVHYAGLPEASETDIAGPTKLFFRRRRPIRAFFERHGLRAGDRIEITRSDGGSYSVSPLR